MAEVTWEKGAGVSGKSASKGRLLYLVGGLLLIGAVIVLALSGTLTGARFYISVDELLSDPQYVGQTVRITGAVVGETIVLDNTDPNKIVIEFSVVHIPTNPENLAEVLNQAANNPDLVRLPVYVENKPMPELLQHESQAIMTGVLGEDGVFYASELMFKCPSRFDNNMPDVLEENHSSL